MYRKREVFYTGGNPTTSSKNSDGTPIEVRGTPDKLRGAQEFCGTYFLFWLTLRKSGGIGSFTIFLLNSFHL